MTNNFKAFLAVILVFVVAITFACNAQARGPIILGKMPHSEAVGGDTLLTGEVGPCEQLNGPGWRVAQSTDKKGKVRLHGCWSQNGDKVGIIWQDGDARVYRSSSFGLGIGS